MIHRDGVKIVGHGRFWLVEKGRILQEIEWSNLITGRDLVAKLLLGNGTPVDYMSLGSDGKAPDKTQNQLGNELNRQKINSTVRTNYTITYEAEFRGSWTGTIREAGLFNKSGTDNGEMLSRVQLSEEVVKNSTTELYAEWVVEVE